MILINNLNNINQIRKQSKTFYEPKKENNFMIDLYLLINNKKKQIDLDNENSYDDIFSKRITLIFGSEETVFYVSKLLLFLEMEWDNYPIL